jgi:hypothetical protein
MKPNNYKAAGFIFYRFKYVSSLKRTYVQVYLQYEAKHSQWSHFGGKREPYENDSFNTAYRELQEESCWSLSFLNQLKSLKSILLKKYFTSSKMMVYYLNITKSEPNFQEANWFTVGALPNNTRPHIIEQINEIELLDFINYFSKCGIANSIN